MQIFNYHNPVKIIFGRNAVRQLSQIVNHCNVLLITDKMMTSLGYVEKIKKYVSIVSRVIDTVPSHPDIKYLQSVYSEAHTYTFDMIVALGGGSVIDAAKVISVYNQTPDFKFIEDCLTANPRTIDYSHIPLVAIPTTAGTGSEVTPWATVWDREKQKKYSLSLPLLWPTACICDPVFTQTLPQSATIETGLDALSHCFDSIWNINANPITLRYATTAANLILDTLPIVIKNPDDSLGREKMMLAALWAGLAFSNTQTSIAHALSYFITLHKQVPHGLASAFALPDIIDAVLGENEIVDQQIKTICGELSSVRIRKFYDELQVAAKLDAYGITQQDIALLKQSLVGTARSGNSLVNVEKLFSIFEKQLTVVA